MPQAVVSSGRRAPVVAQRH